MSTLSSTNSIYAGSSDGKICSFRIDSLFETTRQVSTQPIRELSEGLSGSPVPVVKFIDNTKQYFGESRIVPLNNTLIDPTSVSAVVTNDNKIILDGINNNSPISDKLGITGVYSSPVIADLNKDGKQEIIFSADNKLYVINQNGVMIDNFPFSVVGVDKISSGVAVADLDGDGLMEVIFGTADGRIYAYNTNGKVLDGFPVLTGTEVRSTPAIVNNGGKFGIIVYSQDGYLYGFKTPWDYDETRIQWRNYLKDKNHKNYNPDVLSSSITGPCLPKDKVYNWPNPAYGSSTNIRYYLGNDAGTVQIKIMDLAGELVTTLNGTNFKGFDNEAVWDITKVQSGIYIAVIQLTGGSCNETASIKVAVVK
jgi:hypothetical protein